MITITKVSREVSKTIFLESYTPGKRGSINAKAMYEASTETLEKARAISHALNAFADKDVTEYLEREIAKQKAAK